MHIFLSYPKSGRTWVRFMVNNYLCQINTLNCENVFEAENLLKNTPHAIEWTHLSGAMILKRHYWSMGPVNIENVKNANWLLLSRNFQATLASAYFQARDRIKVFTGTPSEFLRDTRYGVIKLVSFYNMWEQIRSQLSNVHILAYENLLLDVHATFREILRGLTLPLQDDLIDQVIDQSSFDNMKQLSTQKAYEKTPLAPIDPGRPETFKVRQGGSGESIFTSEDIDYIERISETLFLAKDKPEYRFCLGRPMKKPDQQQSENQRIAC